MSPKNKNHAKPVKKLWSEVLERPNVLLHPQTEPQSLTEKLELITSNSTRATKEYTVVVGSCAEELNKLVNDKLNEDWDVIGGVSSCIETSPYHSRIVMSQALTRTKK